ncbi:hypothetical protein B9G54_04315 [Alloscardovia macacae]|uniref:hypothetical protein n=1 Tax=Alloscardovia macacae TaxID=1160091 RepID=UPI000A2D796C|nr:hypothetical protein [Alloscardovia macacae]OTA26614.1 hypothetical protein B9G54_04315 [Alloscardovia macacae]
MSQRRVRTSLPSAILVCLFITGFSGCGIIRQSEGTRPTFSVASVRAILRSEPEYDYVTDTELASGVISVNGSLPLAPTGPGQKYVVALFCRNSTGPVSVGLTSAHRAPHTMFRLESCSTDTRDIGGTVSAPTGLYPDATELTIAAADGTEVAAVAYSTIDGDNPPPAPTYPDEEDTSPRDEAGSPTAKEVAYVSPSSRPQLGACSERGVQESISHVRQTFLQSSLSKRWIAPGHTYFLTQSIPLTARATLSEDAQNDARFLHYAHKELNAHLDVSERLGSESIREKVSWTNPTDEMKWVQLGLNGYELDYTRFTVTSGCRITNEVHHHATLPTPEPWLHHN